MRMKLFISVDMEGLAGITNWRQETEEKERFRDAMHTQLRWVVEGIRQSDHQKDIDEIIVADSHGGGTNLSYAEVSGFDDRISLVSGSPRPYYMMSCLDRRCAMVFLVGYHAGVGEARANMDHSFSSRLIHNLWINDRKMNESTTNAAYAGSMGVPVALVVGDSGLKTQLIEQKMMPWVEFVCTKDSLGRTAAKFHCERQLHEETINAVEKALSGHSSYPLYQLSPPYTLDIEFTDSAMAASVARLENTHLKDARTISFTGNGFPEVYEMIMYACTLAKEN